MTPRDRPLKMPEPSQDSMFSESSMSLPLLLLLTDLTRSPRKRETFSSSISEEELSMSHSSPSKKEFLKLRLPMETLILEEKISITELLTSALKTSKRRLALTSLAMTELSEDLEPNARRPREFSQLPFLLPLNAMPSLKEKITMPTFQEPSSKNSALTCSESALLPLRTYSRTPRLLRDKFMTSCLLEDQPESPRFNN